MSWCSKPRAVVAAAALAAAALAAGLPRPADAQSIREADLHVLAIASKPLFGGIGAGFAWRDVRRTRVRAAVTAGIREGGDVAARADLVGHFLLDPAKREGSAVYGGGGVSVQAAAGKVTPFVVLVLGAENAPGGRGGSYVEIGVGGGVRGAIGYRWRKRSAPGR